MKLKVLIVGGMANNIPRQLHEYFTVVKQLEQSQKRVAGNLPIADYIIVIRNWVSHNLINSVKLQYPKHPFIWVNKGWRNMMDELIRRGLIQKPVEVDPNPEAGDEFADDGLTPEGAPEPAIDPIEQMSDEELEKLTRPDEKPQEAPATVDKFLFDRNVLWNKRLEEWSDRWAERVNVSPMTISKHFAAKTQRYTLEASIKYFPSVERSLVNKMIIGFCKMRSSFDADPTKPLSARNWTKEKNVNAFATPKPQILSDDVTAILVNAQKLVDKRNGLLSQIETLKEEVAKVDKDLEAAKPLILAVENMKRIAGQIKASAEKELSFKVTVR